MSDFDALWVSMDEWVSESFAANTCGQEESGIPVVYRVMQNLDKAAGLDQTIVNEMMNALGLEDPRDLIPHLEMEGYDGWTTLGSIGSRIYTDIAIFRSEVEIDTMKVFIDGKWTEYFDPEEFSEKMTGKMESDHLERFTRVMHV
jgi:hypothetical protein